MEDSFLNFWAAYPRKEAKKDAAKAWGQMTEAQKFAASESIALHVKYWNLAGRSKQYIPLPASWLRGERWEDELEMPQPERQADAWWASQEGIERKARELSMWPPKSGEGWHELKSRILGRLKAA